METKNIYQKLLEVKKVGIKLQRDTEGYGYKYATLAQIQEKLNSELEKQGLLVMHSVDNNSVCTIIINTDKPEERLLSSIPMTEGTKAQDKGSEITYYRRYNLLSLLDLEVEDDDGKKAQDSKPKFADNSDLEWIAQKNIDNLKGLLAKGETFSLKDIRAKYKISKDSQAKLKEIGIQ